MPSVSLCHTVCCFSGNKPVPVKDSQLCVHVHASKTQGNRSRNLILSSSLLYQQKASHFITVMFKMFFLLCVKTKTNTSDHCGFIQPHMKNYCFHCVIIYSAKNEIKGESCFFSCVKQSCKWCIWLPKQNLLSSVVGKSCASTAISMYKANENKHKCVTVMSRCFFYVGLHLLIYICVFFPKVGTSFYLHCKNKLNLNEM